jgi:hypothetical protein
MWLEAFRAKYDGNGTPFERTEFDQLLGHCQAVCDGPATCLTLELLEAYPDAKVVLSNRDVDAWQYSVMNAVIKNIFTPKAISLDWLARITGSPNRWTRSMFVRVFTDGYQGDFEKNGKKGYQEHYDMVRALVPPENLLEYHVEERWRLLCKFLGKEQPMTEFPNGNTKEELERRIGAVVTSEIKQLKRIIFI